MLVLAVADARNTSNLGPVAAIGVACAMVAGLTLLPALLTIFGRVGFWPRRSNVEYDPDHPSIARQGVWRRVGDRVLERPGLALLVTVSLFVAASLLVFAGTGNVDWAAGVSLGVGNAFGAWLGARAAVKRGPGWIRWVLVVTGVAAAVKMIADTMGG